METIKLSKEFESYKKYFHKCNIDLSDLDYNLNHYNIIMTTETYKKLGRKNFPTKPTKTKTETIDTRHFACIVSGIGFFNDRIELGYTCAGYIVTRIMCKNPDNTIKIVRKFKYENK